LFYVFYNGRTQFAPTKKELIIVPKNTLITQDAQTKNKNNPQLLKFFDPNFFTKKFGGVRGEALKKQKEPSGFGAKP